ncbi:MAG: hypothetical protein WBV94_32545 [Blastocatellia bacterium]
MELFTNKIFLVIVVCLWLFFCITLYRKYRRAAWLAGITGASGLFFLGVTIVASFMVAGALLLLPLWVGLGVLKAVHLFSANRKAMESFLAPSGSSNATDGRREDQPSNPALAGQSESDMYI